MAKKGGKASNLISMVLCAGAAPSMLAGARTDANGQPVKRYVKDLIRVGDFEVPHTGTKFSVTPDMLDHWVTTFSRMKAGGVKVPIPEDHTSDPSKNRGYVEDIFRDGDTLYMAADLIGEDAIKLASRTEVSIYVPTEFKDGAGNVYQHPIAHVALTPVPVIPGQGSFVPIAASRVPVLRLSQGDSDVEMLTKIAQMLGISTDGMNEQALFDAIAAKLGTQKSETTTALARVTKLEQDLKLAQDALKTKTPVAPTAIELKLSRQNRQLQLDKLVAEGRITPKVRDELAETWIGKDNKALELSLDAASDGRFDAMIAALAHNSPKELREQTGAQTIALARGDNGAASIDPDLEKRIKAAHGLA